MQILQLFKRGNNPTYQSVLKQSYISRSGKTLAVQARYYKDKLDEV